ncbi:MAG: hypothetical protein O7G32_03940 [SAR324 cluster bacterium]|nr:hypothetical protein [SAR324 cluster bacterium]
METEARLNRLEKQCRLYRNMFLLAGLAALALAGLGAAQGQPPVIKARRFEVVNAEGRRLATLHHTNDGSGGLTLYNQQGRALIQAGMNRQGHGVLEVLNAAGRPVLDVYAEPSGKGVVMVCDTRRRQCRNLVPGP